LVKKDSFRKSFFTIFSVFLLWLALSILNGLIEIFVVLIIFSIILFFTSKLDSNHFTINPIDKIFSSFFAIAISLSIFSIIATVTSLLNQNLNLDKQYLIAAFLNEAFPRSLYTYGYFIQISILLILLRRFSHIKFLN
jgi:hypothetical protein